MKKLMFVTALVLALQFSLPLAGVITAISNAQEEPAPAPPKPESDFR